MKMPFRKNTSLRARKGEAISWIRTRGNEMASPFGLATTMLAFFSFGVFAEPPAFEPAFGVKLYTPANRPPERGPFGDFDEPESDDEPSWEKEPEIYQSLMPLPPPSPSPSPSPDLPEAPSVEISGRVVEKGTRRPVANLSLYAFPPRMEKPIKTVTDGRGNFKISIPPGKWKWLISASGFVRYERWDGDDGTDETERTLYVEKTSYLVYETKIVDKEDNRDDKTKTLRQEDFANLPGANGDPVKAVQNLPGVNRPPPLGAQVIIEGSAPRDTKYSLDTQGVPLIFHFTGLSSVVIPEAVDRVDYLSAGYGPEFGDSMSGLVNLYTRSPKTDALHGFLFADLLNTGGLLEGPITQNSSFLIGGRQSYIGAVLKAALSGNKDFNFTVAPDFEDLIAEFQWEISERDRFRLIAFGSNDSLAFVLSQPVKSDPSLRGTFSQSTSFFRLIPQLTHKFDGGIVGRLWLGLGRDWINYDISGLYEHYHDYVLTGRAELEIPLVESWKSYFGFQQGTTWATDSFQLPAFYSSGGIPNPVSVTSVVTQTRPYVYTNLAFYWRNVIHPGESPWTFIPGVRLDYYTQTSQVLPQPRAAIRYLVGPGFTLRSAGGLYMQAPQADQTDPLFGNPAITAQRAWHVTTGFEKDFRENSSDGWVVSADAFYKKLENLVIFSTDFITPVQPEYYSNKGSGKILGMEFLAKYNSRAWTAWLAYTLSRSTRTSPPASESVFAYDQTHSINAIGSVDLGGNWKISARARYVTGNPYTALNGGILDVDNDVYIPVRGPLYTQRLSPFFQLDVRVDKKWVFDTWILSAYLDIENLTNQKNPQQINYSYDYRQTATITGLPVFPTLGVKGEF